MRRDIVNEAIDHYGPIIESQARAFSVDPNLIRAIIFEEQTKLMPVIEGFPGEQIGFGSTVGLGQITVGTYGYTRQQLLDPKTNIQAIALHLHVIGRSGPLLNPRRPAASLGTKHNCGSCQSISAYGERIEAYYDAYSSGGSP